MILPVLALVTVTFSPPAPAVGDRITLDFKAAVKLDPSPAYEVLAEEGRTVVVRTFTPKPFELTGTQGNVRFRNLVIPVRSVLKQNDDLKPAPLTPPAATPYPRAPFIAIGIAALVAALAWLAAWFFARRSIREAVPAIPPDVRFRRAVHALLEDERHPQRWAALADATRAFLDATRPHLGSELTTSEMIPRLQDDERVVAEILRQGDAEKFSPWGAPPRDFNELATRALVLAEPKVEEEAAAA